MQTEILSRKEKTGHPVNHTIWFGLTEKTKLVVEGWGRR